MHGGQKKVEKVEAICTRRISKNYSFPFRLYSILLLQFGWFWECLHHCSDTLQFTIQFKKKRTSFFSNGNKIWTVDVDEERRKDPTFEVKVDLKKRIYYFFSDQYSFA